MTHSKPTKEVGSKGVTMFFGSHFVSFNLNQPPIALNQPPCGSKLSNSQIWVKMTKKNDMTHSKPMKEVKNSVTRMLYGHYFVSFKFL